MIIVDFTRQHITAAIALMHFTYQEESRHVSSLPDIEFCPDYTYFADNGQGVAAFEGDTMLGFLCATSPFGNAFRSTDVSGVFSPMGANASVAEHRAAIYAAMYQKASRKWVDSGAVSHSICLYAHDQAAQQQFFKYGFGQRCIDAIRLMEPIECPPCEGYQYSELSPDRLADVYPLQLLLNQHYMESPFFMNRPMMSCEDFCASRAEEGDRSFIAKYNGNICSFLIISESGETFITETVNYRHINSAYCLKEHRGKGVHQNLLNYAILHLKEEGVTHLGVDFESLNPAAYGFWSKYFTMYTHSMTRRIDERILNAKSSDI